MKSSKPLLVFILVAGAVSVAHFISSRAFTETEASYLAQIIALNAGLSILFAATAIAIKNTMLPGYFYLIASNIKLLVLALAVFLHFKTQFDIGRGHILHLMAAYFTWVIAEVFFYFKLLKNRPLKKQEGLSTEKVT